MAEVNINSCKLVYPCGEFVFEASNHKEALKMAKNHMVNEYVLNANLSIDGLECYAVTHDFNNNATKAEGILQTSITGVTVNLNENFFANK